MDFHCLINKLVVFLFICSNFMHKSFKNVFMRFIKFILIVGLSLFSLIVFSQSRSEDSVYARELIMQKLKSLDSKFSAEYISLYSNEGTIVLLYQIDKKIKAVKCNFKKSVSPKFRKLRLTGNDKLSFKKCMLLSKFDTTVNYSNCIEFVHSFHRVYFSIINNQHRIEVGFTTDCSEMLKKHGMMDLYFIYNRFFIK